MRFLQHGKPEPKDLGLMRTRARLVFPPRMHVDQHGLKSALKGHGFSHAAALGMISLTARLKPCPDEALGLVKCFEAA